MPELVARPVPRGLGLILLYGSRLAGVLVSLLFLPLYARLLGPHGFGLAALVLTAQGLSVMLDLGMAGLLTRDIASQAQAAGARARWRRAEQLLSLAFACMVPMALLVSLAQDWSVGLALATIALLWAVTLQNLAQAAMVARGDVPSAALIQGVGVLARAGLTALALLALQASLEAFVLSQLFGALAHLAVNRWWGQRRLPTEPTPAAEPLQSLWRRGLPLFLVMGSGAAVLHLDKLLIGVWMSPAAITPYFLATTFSLTPIAILAAPLAQYFQPRITSAHAAGDRAAVGRVTQQLIVGLLAAVVLPSAAMWTAREPLIRLWLRDEALAHQVAGLAAWLLPAAALGAVGNVPLVLLNALGDFAFQARLAALLSVLTLAGVASAAARGQLALVCSVYLGYYALLTCSLWWRASRQAATAEPARRNAVLALVGGLLAIIPLALLSWT